MNKFGMVMLSPMKYNNTYALAVSKQMADTYHLQTISDIKPIQEKIKPVSHWNLMIEKMVIWVFKSVTVLHFLT